MKGILRQFSVARTPQQNKVAERRNRTLIEAARTMLVDSNRVLVVKPHNKTPYKLFHGKFDGKADEGFFIVYSLNSKAFRVFNSRTRIVEENLHIKFSESIPNAVGTQSNGFADPKSSHDDGFKPSSDDGNKADKDSRKESECKDHEKEDNVNNTNIVNAAGTNEVNAVEADMNNLDTTIQVSPIPTTRIHKDHPLDQVIGYLQSATQTRKMSKNLE
ncbi:putative ribonuclease H-like domain-containing protein, partial [Tanacetum coccineum]